MFGIIFVWSERVSGYFMPGGLFELLLAAPVFSRLGHQSSFLPGPLHTDCGDVLLVGDPSQLPLLYAACETVLVGGSLLEDLPPLPPQPSLLGGSGGFGACEHLASPAVAGCAVLIGAHGGVVSSMAEDLNSAAVAAAEEAAAAVRNTGE